MAKKPQSDSIIDMFARLGEDLKMPSMDIERVIEHHRKNLEAFEKASRAAASGATDVFSRQRTALEETLREVSEMARDLGSGASPQELMSRQSDFARRSFESAVKNASEIGEVMRKSSSESVEILRERIREAMAEIREGYDKKS
ncbi:TIGR01841 family phasin [Nitratireductor mangrovi]|uniref:TIGR01841 family phasin n=1 Tax=Nitratireductor mangrovi TaxID=2599600 RepID=A0A5B8L319_9HYPH|nr:TIGR01841 family phasin [Nitratireductor mangrovi]QDZ02233.1 TIGR01841 family phasin [Nitratireductor mangrovi]